MKKLLTLSLLAVAAAAFAEDRWYDVDPARLPSPAQTGAPVAVPVAFKDGAVLFADCRLQLDLAPSGAGDRYQGQATLHCPDSGTTPLSVELIGLRNAAATRLRSEGGRLKGEIPVKLAVTKHSGKLDGSYVNQVAQMRDEKQDTYWAFQSLDPWSRTRLFLPTDFSPSVVSISRPNVRAASLSR